MMCFECYQPIFFCHGPNQLPVYSMFIACGIVLMLGFTQWCSRRWISQTPSQANLLFWIFPQWSNSLTGWKIMSFGQIFLQCVKVAASLTQREHFFVFFLFAVLLVVDEFLHSCFCIQSYDLIEFCRTNGQNNDNGNNTKKNSCFLVLWLIIKFCIMYSRFQIVWDIISVLSTPPFPPFPPPQSRSLDCKPSNSLFNVQIKSLCFWKFFCFFQSPRPLPYAESFAFGMRSCIRCICLHRKKN